MSKAFASKGDLEPKAVTFSQLSESAWAYTAEGDPNTGIVIGEDSVMVVDAQATPKMAEKVIEKIRAVVTPRFKYLRNYLTDRPYMQPSYKDPWPVSKRFRELMAAGEMNETQLVFFSDERVPEELYDLENDPHEIHNLAADPRYAYGESVVTIWPPQQGFAAVRAGMLRCGRRRYWCDRCSLTSAGYQLAHPFCLSGQEILVVALVLGDVVECLLPKGGRRGIFYWPGQGVDQAAAGLGGNQIAFAFLGEATVKQGLDDAGSGGFRAQSGGLLEHRLQTRIGDPLGGVLHGRNQCAFGEVCRRFGLTGLHGERLDRTGCTHR